jgi:hypothetical protein
MLCKGLTRCVVLGFPEDVAGAYDLAFPTGAARALWGEGGEGTEASLQRPTFALSLRKQVNDFHHHGWQD